jgi:hypothetical protein
MKIQPDLLDEEHSIHSCGRGRSKKELLWLMTTNRVVARGFSKYQLEACTCRRAINVISCRTACSQSVISLKKHTSGLSASLDVASTIK